MRQRIAVVDQKHGGGTKVEKLLEWIISAATGDAGKAGSRVVLLGITFALWSIHSDVSDIKADGAVTKIQVQTIAGRQDVAAQKTEDSIHSRDQQVDAIRAAIDSSNRRNEIQDGKLDDLGHRAGKVEGKLDAIASDMNNFREWIKHRRD